MALQWSRDDPKKMGGKSMLQGDAEHQGRILREAVLELQRADRSLKQNRDSAAPSGRKK
jgi:hypothetical protein